MRRLDAAITDGFSAPIHATGEPSATQEDQAPAVAPAHVAATAQAPTEMFSRGRRRRFVPEPRRHREGRRGRPGGAPDASGGAARREDGHMNSIDAMVAWFRKLFGGAKK